MSDTRKHILTTNCMQPISPILVSGSAYSTITEQELQHNRTLHSFISGMHH